MSGTDYRQLDLGVGGLTANKTLKAVGFKAAGKPSGDQLALINGFALGELTEDSVYVRTAYLAHNGIDRDREAFNDALLADFVTTLPGKGLFIKHPGGWDGDSGPGVGRWFEAKVITMSLDEARNALREPNLQFPPGVNKAKLLESSFYIPRTGKNADLIADIDAGVAGDVSIGFRATSRAPIEDEQGQYLASLLMGPGEAYEGSLVWMGAQSGARVVKAAGRNNEENNVTLEELQNQVKNLKSEKAAADTKAAENETKAKAFDALKTAVGELADKPDTLKGLVADANGYRSGLIDEAVKHRRLLGMTGDTDEAVNSAKSFYASMPLDMLKSEVAALADKSPEGKGSQLTGGDPNATGGDGGQAKGLRDSSVTKKALGVETK